MDKKPSKSFRVFYKFSGQIEFPSESFIECKTRKQVMEVARNIIFKDNSFADLIELYGYNLSNEHQVVIEKESND